MVDSGEPSSCAAAAASAPNADMRCRARVPLRRGQGVGHLAGLFGQPPAIERDQQRGEREPRPGAGLVDLRQLERRTAPRQWLMELLSSAMLTM